MMLSLVRSSLKLIITKKQEIDMAVKAIKFYATWCGPCKIYGKAWDKVADELKEEVEFIDVDIDKDTTGLAAEYKVTSVPHTVIIKDGNTIQETGRLNVADLKNLILN
tara:strand:- start:329 stop:652 length:324 start_codon:yes stop_codon:yes gene_type:complete